LTHALIGGTLFFSGVSVSASRGRRWRHRTTGISGVPYHFATLLSATKLKTTALPSLRNITITGGALSPAALAS
jgi:hypothetical protein